MVRMNREGMASTGYEASLTNEAETLGTLVGMRLDHPEGIAVRRCLKGIVRHVKEPMMLVRPVGHH